jgi:LmbE family N-acetylglucosaminyl deacetylase
MAELWADVPERVLAVYAHPDDADVSCGGALARWSAAGAEVHLVICAQGDKGTIDPDEDPGRLAEQRRAEAEAAATTLGVDGVHRLEVPDGELVDDSELRRRIVGLVRQLRPDTVLCPDPTAVVFGDRYVNHRDHRVVGIATLDAVAPAAARPLYHPDAGPPHQVDRMLLTGTLAPSTWVDITDAIDVKLAAVQCHRSQVDGSDGWVVDALRERAADEGRHVGVAYAEAFRCLRLTG